MLKLTVLGQELYNEVTEEFSTQPDVVLELEHSLVSLSKWESKNQKPFLAPGEKTPEEIIDYISCMIISPEVNSEILFRMSQQNLEDIRNYIDSKQSATTFGEMPQRPSRVEVVTSELIYYWMVAFTIPPEYQYWHLNRLFALIRICNVKNSKPKPMSKNEIAMRNREINEQRRQQYNTKG